MLPKIGTSRPNGGVGVDGIRASLAKMQFRPIKEKAKVSAKILTPNMVAYGASTHNGLVRTYNEDRISIVLDLKKPGLQPHSSKQPKF